MKYIKTNDGYRDENGILHQEVYFKHIGSKRRFCIFHESPYLEFHINNNRLHFENEPALITQSSGDYTSHIWYWNGVEIYRENIRVT